MFVISAEAGHQSIPCRFAIIHKTGCNKPPVVSAAEIIIPADLSIFITPSSLRRTTKSHAVKVTFACYVG